MRGVRVQFQVYAGNLLWRRVHNAASACYAQLFDTGSYNGMQFSNGGG
jgi:hypothetical protein